MKIRYQFADGKTSEVEVNEQLGQELTELDRLEYNNNQAQTRRHVSLDMMVEEQGMEFSDGADLGEHAADREMIRHMWNSLLPSQQELLRKVFYEGHSIASIARKEGVNEAAIRNRLRKAYARAKKSF